VYSSDRSYLVVKGLLVVQDKETCDAKSQLAVGPVGQLVAVHFFPSIATFHRNNLRLKQLGKKLLSDYPMSQTIIRATTPGRSRVILIALKAGVLITHVETGRRSSSASHHLT
jgi:hypothetical protein